MATPNSQEVNSTALAVAQQRDADASALIGQIDAKQAAGHYAPADLKKLKDLKAQLVRARESIAKETKARQALQSAYNSSTYAEKDADPAVKKAKTDLAAVRKQTKAVTYKKKNLVNEICQPCIEKDINKIVDCDTPYYATYGSGGGPKYKDCNDYTLASFPGWQALLDSKVKTASEKNVLAAMAANEGELDSIQAYDSEIITVGSMQKTVNPEGTGELPTQLKEFRDDPATAAVFERELGSKGFSVDKKPTGKTKKDGTPILGKEDHLFFTDPKDPDAKPITGAELRKFIRDNKDRWADTLGPFRSLGRTPEFQKKQVLDFNDRLVAAMNKQPTGYDNDIGDFVTSERGGALVLDQSVNRPGYVSTDFGKALDKFYADNPTVSKDPTTWSASDRAAREDEILKNYEATRRGTDMPGRADKLDKKGLDKSPNSLSFP